MEIANNHLTSSQFNKRTTVHDTFYSGEQITVHGTFHGKVINQDESSMIIDPYYTTQEIFTKSNCHNRHNKTQRSLGGVYYFEYYDNSQRPLHGNKYHFLYRSLQPHIC